MPETAKSKVRALLEDLKTVRDEQKKWKSIERIMLDDGKKDTGLTEKQIEELYERRVQS